MSDNKTTKPEVKSFKPDSKATKLDVKAAKPEVKAAIKSSNPVQQWSHQNYLVRRKILKFFGAAFHIYDLNGNVVFYSNQKAFKLKADIRLYTGEDMKTELLLIQARKAIDFSSVYDVIDSSTNIKVGGLRRKGIKSMIKDEWVIMDKDDKDVGFIKEDNYFLAVVRRLITNLIPQKYSGELNGRQVCEFKQNFNPFVMKINLDFSMDPSGLLDRRLGIAGAVLLCAIEGRQR